MVTQRWPERLPSEPWTPSSPPLQQWSETDTQSEVYRCSLVGLPAPVFFTFALASRLASASAAIARCSCWGNFTSLISTRSTLMPHASVASSKDSYTRLESVNLWLKLLWHAGVILTCILWDIPSLSDNSSDRFLVPSTFLKVVWASRRVDVCAFETLATDEMGQCMRKYTTPSTATVTESLVRICRVKTVTRPLHRFTTGGCCYQQRWGA